VVLLLGLAMMALAGEQHEPAHPASLSASVSATATTPAVRASPFFLASNHGLAQPEAPAASCLQPRLPGEGLEGRAQAGLRAGARQVNQCNPAVASHSHGSMGAHGPLAGLLASGEEMQQQVHTTRPA